ncbi:MAG: magnesium-translocating P-type ATPase [Thermoguttaceae bacterium]
MPILRTFILPKNILTALRSGSNHVQSSPLLAEIAQSDPEQVFKRLETSEQGLSSAEAASRAAYYGPNVVTKELKYRRLRILGRACVNPLVILLLLLASVSALSEYYQGSNDYRAATVMLSMVVLGVALRFFQEARADNAAAKLKAMISVTATVVRDGQPQELPLGQLVPGDVVQLSAGDMIPADLRIISSKDLFIIQSSLTGESLPVEKFDTKEDAGKPVLELKNVCFLGTSVESGTATGVIVETGFTTYLGGMAQSIVGQNVQTSFDQGVAKFTWLMIRFMLVMVPLVFLINGLTKHNWIEAFFFALAVAVGLTPEMLPMIVSVCLSRGAIAMSRHKVIVKRLNSIQNLGAMDVLCTDKTGTLTLDRVILERHCDVVRNEDEGVLVLAYLNSHFQTGLKNVLDRAILQFEEIHEKSGVPNYKKIDEMPFDFSRKRMSVVVETPDGVHRLICKGATEAVFQRCNRFELEGKIYPVDPLLIADLKEYCDDLSADGFRVLAIAYKDVERRAAYSKEDEQDLILKGYVAFLDPPKDTAAPAILALRNHGVTVKVLTGDNELVSRKICNEVGLATDRVLLGGQVEAMSDEELADAVEGATLFARLSPAHKQRVIRALHRKGHVVGFLGDGINDSPALRTADVGISVDSAVDIAKEAADIILLEKSLMVLGEGVMEGRKVFANILKYVRMGASSNFGNMFSVLGASAFLPFLPMMPLQILTNNLLYDFSQVPIPADEVDAEQIAKPRPWHMGQLARFILFVGPCSSIFDYTTYLMMLVLFHCFNTHLLPPPELAERFAGIKDVSLTYAASLFQTGWFVESLLTQTLIIHIIRTNRIPFLQSRASWPLIVTTAIIMALGMWLPTSPIGPWLGFVPLPPLYWPLLLLTLLCYVLLTQGVKTWLIRKMWI